MNGRKARKLRKDLGMTKHNLRNPEYARINPVQKVVYFRNPLGVLVPVEVVRSTIVNKSLNYYRKVKKQVSRGL